MQVGRLRQLRHERFHEASPERTDVAALKHLATHWRKPIARRLRESAVSTSNSNKQE